MHNKWPCYRRDERHKVERSAIFGESKLERIEERPESICLADPFPSEGKPRLNVSVLLFDQLCPSNQYGRNWKPIRRPFRINVTPVTAYWVSHALVTLAGRDFSNNLLVHHPRPLNNAPIRKYRPWRACRSSRQQKWAGHAERYGQISIKSNPGENGLLDSMKILEIKMATLVICS